MSTPLQWRKSILKRRSSTLESTGACSSEPGRLYAASWCCVECLAITVTHDAEHLRRQDDGLPPPKTSSVYDFSWGEKRCWSGQFGGNLERNPWISSVCSFPMNSWTVFVWHCSHSSFPSRADISSLCAWLADDINNYSSSKKPQSHAF